MKILSLSENQGDFIVKIATLVEKELAKLVPEMLFAGPGYPAYIPGETVDQTVKRLMPDADWVIDTSFFAERKLNPSRSYKVACFLADMHYNYALGGGPEKICEAFNAVGYDAVITLIKHLNIAGGYPNLWQIDPAYYEKHLKMPILHSPACIDPTVFRDLHLKRDIDASFLGCAVLPFYPIRYSIATNLPAWGPTMGLNVVVGGPPEHTEPYKKHIPTLYKQGAIVGERYVEYLNRSKCFLFDSSIFGYTVYKFFEAQACGCVAMSDPPLDMEAVHLVPEENFIPITISNWSTRLMEVLKDEGLRERVAKAGYESTMKYNTAAVRARALLDFLGAHLKD
jgi:glycosyltransferase involved in cell wall biosynthesis